MKPETSLGADRLNILNFSSPRIALGRQMGRQGDQMGPEGNPKIEKYRYKVKKSRHKNALRIQTPKIYRTSSISGPSQTNKNLDFACEGWQKQHFPQITKKSPTSA